MNALQRDNTNKHFPPPQQRHIINDLHVGGLGNFFQFFPAVVHVRVQLQDFIFSNPQ